MGITNHTSVKLDRRHLNPAKTRKGSRFRSWSQKTRIQASKTIFGRLTIWYNLLLIMGVWSRKCFAILHTIAFACRFFQAYTFTWIFIGVCYWNAIFIWRRITNIDWARAFTTLFFDQPNHPIFKKNDPIQLPHLNWNGSNGIKDYWSENRKGIKNKPFSHKQAIK